MQARRGAGRHRDPMVFGYVRRTLRRIRSERGGAQSPILILPQVTSPEMSLVFRATLVLLLLAAVFAVFLLDRSGLQDNIDGHVS